MNIFKRLFGKRSEPAGFYLGFQVRSALPIRAIQVVTIDENRRPEQLQLAGFTTTTPIIETED
jgi:hypothetical protein